MQAGGAAQRVGMPRVVGAGAEHAGDVGGGGDAHAGAHVAEVARDPRAAPPARGAASASTAPASTGGRSASAITPVLGASGASRSNTARLDLAREEQHPLALGRGELGCEPLERVGVAGQHLDDVGAEAQRVLERVEPFEHR